MSDLSISIILPVRNGGDYLREAIDSVLKQTDEKWKLLVLENGSTDGTVAFLERLNDSRISVFPASRPLNIEENWGRIKDLPVEGWASFLGHDDILQSDFVASAKLDIAQNPHASLWMSHFEIIDSEGKFIRKCQPMPASESGTQFLNERWMHRRDSYGTGYVFRFADYKACGGIPPFPGLLYADDYLWFSLGSLSGGYCSPRIGFSYRAHAQSAARQSNALLAVNGAHHFLSCLVEDSVRDPRLKKFLDRMGRRFAEHTELCFWQNLARSADRAVSNANLPDDWIPLRNSLPMRPEGLKFWVLRLGWTLFYSLKISCRSKLG